MSLHVYLRRMQEPVPFDPSVLLVGCAEVILHSSMLSLCVSNHKFNGSKLKLVVFEFVKNSVG